MTLYQKFKMLRLNPLAIRQDIQVRGLKSAKKQFSLSKKEFVPNETDLLSAINMDKKFGRRKSVRRERELAMFSRNWVSLRVSLAKWLSHILVEHIIYWRKCTSNLSNLSMGCLIYGTKNTFDIVKSYKFDVQPCNKGYDE